MKPYETRYTEVAVLPKGAKLFDEACTRILIRDDSGGEFIEIYQCRNDGDKGILVAPDEWPIIKNAIDSMIGNLQNHDDNP